jgi:hypothetical protein
MAHYAFINDDGTVDRVIVGRDEDDNVVDGVTYDWEQYYGDKVGMLCRRTSYNTSGGKHLLGGVPFRGNYAGEGMLWNEELDCFHSPSPYPSWVLNPETALWDPPTPDPSTDENVYSWSEEDGGWVPWSE